MWRSSTRPDAAAVVGEAVRLTFESGLRAVTHRAVADRLRVPVRVVAAAYPREADLTTEVFTTIVAAELADMKRRVLANPSPTAQMTALLEQFADPEAAADDGVWLEACSLGRTDPVLGARVRDEQARWHEFVTSIIRRGVRSNDFLAADPETAAAQLLAMMDGVNAYALVGYGTDVDRMRLLASFARTELGLVWQAVATA